MLFNFQRSMRKQIVEAVSVTNAEGPPVPIPNTEVKLCSGDNTLRATVREDSSMLTRKRVLRETLGHGFCKRKKRQKTRWGCSSAGRAPALQAGGQGFESLHLHQKFSERKISPLHSSLFTLHSSQMKRRARRGRKRSCVPSVHKLLLTT